MNTSPNSSPSNGSNELGESNESTSTVKRRRVAQNTPEVMCQPSNQRMQQLDKGSTTDLIATPTKATTKFTGGNKRNDSLGSDPCINQSLDRVIRAQIKAGAKLKGTDVNPRFKSLKVARASGAKAHKGQEVTLAHATAMQFTDLVPQTDKWHKVPLPADFELPQVVVEVLWNGKTARTRIVDTQLGKSFSVLSAFVKHLNAAGYKNKANRHVFEVETYIDSARKQIRHAHRMVAPEARINPALKNQTALTPPEVYNFIERFWNLKISNFDPCPVNPTFDGLQVPWIVNADETVYVNPPFKDAGAWATKILHELEAGNCKSVVLLCVSRTQPEWFHETIMAYADVVCAVRKGIKYVGYKKVLPHGCLITKFSAPLVRKTNGVTFITQTVSDWA